MGSVVAMSNASNGQLATNSGPYLYDAYGNCTSGGSPCSTVGTPYLFTGQRFDPETGLYYYRARCYSPSLGRFCQTDPVGYGPDVNWYDYVGDDPTDKTDPSGKCPPCAIAVVARAMVVGAATGAAVDYTMQVAKNANVGVSFKSVAAFKQSISNSMSNISKMKTSDFTNIDKGEIARSAAIGAVGGTVGLGVKTLGAQLLSKVAGARVDKIIEGMSSEERAYAESNAISPNFRDEASGIADKIATVVGGALGVLAKDSVKKELKPLKKSDHPNGAHCDNPAHQCGNGN